MKAPITGLLVLATGFVVLAFMLPTIFEKVSDARTVALSETGLACTTGAADTTCDTTLGTENAYADVTAITVTETAPGSGDLTAGISLASNRTTLTVVGLATSTAYTLTVDHSINDPDLSTEAASFLERIPLFAVLGLLVVGVGGIGRAMYARSR
jgi:hypothetical protein